MASQAAAATGLASVWPRRRVLSLLVTRDLKVKYSGSALGYMWSILDPLLMACVYWFIFGYLVSRRLGQDPYIVFLLCGLLPWQFTNGTIRASMKALSKDAKLIRSTNLPREIWVVRTVLSRMVEFLLTLPVLAFFALVTTAPLHWQVVFFPIALLIQVVMLLGIGLLLAPMTIVFSDVSRLIPIILRLAFYLSPVLYGVHDIKKRSPKLAEIYSFNPLAGIFDLYRTAFFPDQWVGWNGVIVSSVFALVCLALGLLVFRRLEGVVLKEI